MTGRLAEAAAELAVRHHDGMEYREAARIVLDAYHRPTYADGLADAAVHLRAMAKRIRARARTPEDYTAIATLETAADSLAELPVKREPTGLEVRGG